MFVGLAEKEASYYADKLSLFVALGPVSKIPNTQVSLFTMAAEFYDELAGAVSLLGIYHMMDKNWLTDQFTQKLCGVVEWLCRYLADFVASADPTLDDMDRNAVYMGHFPNGIAVKQILHYAQNLREDRF
jgi:hypothetical protein